MYRTQSDFFTNLGGGGYIDDPDQFYQAATSRLGPMSRMATPASLTESMIRRGYARSPMASSLYGIGMGGGHSPLLQALNGSR